MESAIISVSIYREKGCAKIRSFSPALAPLKTIFFVTKAIFQFFFQELNIEAWKSMCVINAHEWIRGHEQVQYLEQNRECCWSSRSVFIDDD